MAADTPTPLQAAAARIAAAINGQPPLAHVEVVTADVLTVVEAVPEPSHTDRTRAVAKGSGNAKGKKIWPQARGLAALLEAAGVHPQ